MRQLYRLFLFSALFILTFSTSAQTATIEDKPDLTCWYEGSYMYIKRLERGWLITNYQGAMVYVMGRNQETLGLCGI